MAEEELKESKDSPESDVPVPDDLMEEFQDDEPSLYHRLKRWYLTHKKWSIPATILVVFLILGGIPFTRYKLAGLALKNSFSVQVLDSETNTPVSGADVSMALKTVQTDSNGKAVIPNLKVGNHSMLVHKKYYSDDMTSGLVPLLKQKNPRIIKLHATGRQVKIQVQNLVTKTPLPNVEIQVAGINAKTDKDG